jgi:hypothetical protein
MSTVENAMPAPSKVLEGQRQAEASHEADTNGPSQPLLDILKDILATDNSVRETLRLEGLDEETVMAAADAVLRESASDFNSRLEELSVARERRNEALKPGSNWKNPENTIGLSLWTANLLAIPGVGIAKLTGHILAWPIWPFFAAVPAVFIIGAFLIAIDPKSQPEATAPTIETETLRRNLRDQLRSLVIVPAIERASLPNFAPAADDTVLLADAPGLTSRVSADGRVQTSSYREVLPNLARHGGMTVGLAGSRGVGKSELLRAFCEDPDDSATIDKGGIIGVVIPAPVAYKAEPFLRVLIRQLAEAVPGYRESIPIPQKIFSAKVALVLTFAIISSGIGSMFLIGPARIDKDTHLGVAKMLDWVLVVIGGGIFVVILIRLIRNQIPAASKFPTRHRDLDLQAADLSQRRRRELADLAANVARKIRYVESRASGEESSYSWRDIGFKSTSGITWDALPLTEPDLVMELAAFVAQLSRGGYRVRIGIDELDKLVEGRDAEKFLTSMKNLLVIRDCSFLLTISENAAAQFAQRGLPIRDVFDSSLDTVVTVQPLTFREARRLAVARLGARGAGSSERISDSQVLLCYCLSGGLPRDFLRYCRRLGEINLSLDGRQSLDRVLFELLKSDLRTRVDGIRAAFADRHGSDSVAVFMAELERVYDVPDGNDTPAEVLRDLVASDMRFAALCRVSENEALRDEAEPGAEQDGIRQARRRVATYLYFVDTVRGAFGNQGMLARAATNGDQSTINQAFEVLADARRNIEIDAATGWRRIAASRRALGLSEVRVFDVAES